MKGLFAHLLLRHFLLIRKEKLVALNVNKAFTIKDILLGCLLHSFTVSMENLNPSSVFSSGHLLHGRVILVREGCVRVPPGFFPATLQDRVSSRNCVLGASGTTGRQHFLQRHSALSPATLGLMHRLE